MKEFTLNGRTYQAAPFTFELLCELEENGISISDIDSKAMSFMRAYVSISMGVKLKTASREIENHIINGGSLEEIMSAISSEMEESGFFQALLGNKPGAEKKAPTKKKTVAKAEE